MTAATCWRWPPVYYNEAASFGQFQSDFQRLARSYLECDRQAGSGGTEGRVNMPMLELKGSFPFRKQIAPSDYNSLLVNEARAHLNRQKPKLYDSYDEARRLVAAGPRLRPVVQPTTTQDNATQLVTHFNNNGNNNNNDDDDSFYAEMAEMQAQLDELQAQLDAERFCMVLSYVIVIVIILYWTAKAGYFTSTIPPYDQHVLLAKNFKAMARERTLDLFSRMDK